MAASVYDQDLNLKATELRLGLPGSDEPDHESSSSPHLVKNNKRRTSSQLDSSSRAGDEPDGGSAPAPKAQVVGWPPVRSYRKNMTEQQKKAAGEQENGSRFYVKVSMDGAPYLRKIDLMFYSSYSDLLKALDNMFKCSLGVYSEREGYNGSDHAPIYEDKDGDWMLVGDVPWHMFITSCKRLRLMRASQVKGSRVD